MTINRKNYLIAWGILFSAGLVWSVVYWHILDHLPDTYSGMAVHGRVVDADTGKPIEGAIVIGIYPLNEPYRVKGNIVAGHLHVEEVTTNANGNYHLAAWGPKARYGDTYLTSNGPQILVYKFGYGVHTGGNGQGDSRFESIQTSFYADRTIKLKRFQGELDQYAYNVRSLSGKLEVLINLLVGARDCAWMSTPKIMIELDRVVAAMRARGVAVYGIPDLETLVSEKGCGTREEFIRRYGNDIKDDSKNSGGTDG